MECALDETIAKNRVKGLRKGGKPDGIGKGWLGDKHVGGIQKKQFKVHCYDSACKPLCPLFFTPLVYLHFKYARF